MQRLIFDTNVVSYVFGEKSQSEFYVEYMTNRFEKYVSFITIVELRFGMKSKGWGATRVALAEKFLRDFRIHSEADQIIDFVVGIRCDIGPHRTLQTEDAIIAATALALSCPLVTHNKKHFEGIPGLKIISAA